MTTTVTSCNRLSGMHSPHAEQAIVCGSGQEVEAVAVGGSGGGEAQGRHSGGVSCEPLQGGNGKTTRQFKRHSAQEATLFSIHRTVHILF